MLTAGQRAHWRRWECALEARHFHVDQLSRESYTPEPWEQLRSLVGCADGVLVLGLRQLSVGEGVWRPDTPEARVTAFHLTSAWMQLEAGLAIMAGLPTLVVAEAGVEEGIFDPRTWSGLVRGASLEAPSVDDAVDAWAASVTAAMQASR
jgi:hypothetical protein